MYVSVVNLTRQRDLGNSVEVARTAAARRKGLLGRHSLLEGEGVWIVPCESVHTFFMRFAIDLVYLDRQYRVKKVKTAVPAWRFSACFSAHSVLELPAGVVQSTHTQPGDALEFSQSAVTRIGYDQPMRKGLGVPCSQPYPFHMEQIVGMPPRV